MVAWGAEQRKFLKQQFELYHKDNNDGISYHEADLNTDSCKELWARHSVLKKCVERYCVGPKGHIRNCARLFFAEKL